MVHYNSYLYGGLWEVVGVVHYNSYLYGGLWEVVGGGTLKQLPLRRSLGGSGGAVHYNSYLYGGLWEVVGGSYTKTVTFTEVSGR